MRLRAVVWWVDAGSGGLGSSERRPNLGDRKDPLFHLGTTLLSTAIGGRAGTLHHAEYSVTLSTSFDVWHYKHLDGLASFIVWSLIDTLNRLLYPKPSAFSCDCEGAIHNRARSSVAAMIQDLVAQPAPRKTPTCEWPVWSFRGIHWLRAPIASPLVLDPRS